MLAVLGLGLVACCSRLLSLCEGELIPDKSVNGFYKILN